VALLLRRRGIERVSPLAGGLDAWRDHGFPLEDVQPPTAPPAELRAPAD
jgi:3-mercaptopyruvate sulfurtransferase SseA